MWVFLMSRVRRWLLMALVLPLAGRLLAAVGARLRERHPRTGGGMVSVGERLDRRSRRRAGRNSDGPTSGAPQPPPAR